MLFGPSWGGVVSRSLPIRKRHAGTGSASPLTSATQESRGPASIAPSGSRVYVISDPEVALGHEASQRSKSCDSLLISWPHASRCLGSRPRDWDVHALERMIAWTGSF
ncbi:rCG59746 [Rattus norvegicus]|uniref:RCG59746 n=1 Tax=Rattus norvegicus TaxID=10116 RepID=A6HQU5_RAT|nr:rCG59746 [Rattus norvegicus]